RAVVRALWRKRARSFRGCAVPFATESGRAGCAIRYRGRTWRCWTTNERGTRATCTPWPKRGRYITFRVTDVGGLGD
ncbi:MAG: hypothetical protein M0P31_19145, partial [Solirubrobacteraceae bacterium]|nr:hypothetical protein [Solirubrobacteraceae bacterium]